jgi:hypothetical protein
MDSDKDMIGDINSIFRDSAFRLIETCVFRKTTPVPAANPAQDKILPPAHTNPMKIRKHITALIGGIAGIANGLFGAGGGTILVPALERFIPLETHKAHATTLAVMLPLSIVSAIIYTAGANVEIKWQAVIFVSVGGVVGGVIGAKILKKITAAWLNILFGLFLAAGAVRMLTL